MSFAILRIQKEHNRAGVASRAAHNLRQRSAAPRADAARSAQNKTIGAKTVPDVLAALDARLAALPKPPQKNAVLVVELMLAASPEWFAAGGKPGLFANEAMEWAYAKFGKENILTASLHRDEKTPHLQILLTPIVEKKGVAKLRASHYFDGPSKMSGLQTEFATHVEKLGLRRGIERKPGEPIKRHTTLKEYYKLVDKIVERATKARQAPAVPALPARGMLGNVSTEDWRTLSDSLDKHGVEVARLHAEAIAGRLYMDSSVGTEVADRLARAQEAAKKAQEEARRAEEREANTQRRIEVLEAAMGRVQAQIEAMTGRRAKLDAEIQRRAELLGIGRLEAHRDQLVEEIAELQRQRGEFDD